MSSSLMLYGYITAPTSYDDYNATALERFPFGWPLPPIVRGPVTSHGMWSYFPLAGEIKAYYQDWPKVEQRLESLLGCLCASAAFFVWEDELSPASRRVCYVREGAPLQDDAAVGPIDPKWQRTVESERLRSS